MPPLAKDLEQDYIHLNVDGWIEEEKVEDFDTEIKIIAERSHDENFDFDYCCSMTYTILHELKHCADRRAGLFKDYRYGGFKTKKRAGRIPHEDRPCEKAARSFERSINIADHPALFYRVKECSKYFQDIKKDFDKKTEARADRAKRKLAKIYK